MIFEQVLRAVDELNHFERRRVQQHVDRLPKRSTQLTAKEWMRRLNVAMRLLRLEAARPPGG